MRENKHKKLPKAENIKTAKRLLRYIIRMHRKRLLIVAVCVIASSIVNVSMSIFLKMLIDNYIIPLVQSETPDFTPLFYFTLKIGIVFAFGVFASFMYTRLMVYVSDSTVNAIRQDMFRHTQNLPISYYDTHPHGEIMNYYTNDINTVDQMIASTLPSAISSALTISMVLIAMISQSIVLTTVVLFTVFLMVLLIKKRGTKSSAHFMDQQALLAEQNAFNEEMMAGMKVVKVFNHEEEATDEFQQINKNLIARTTKANFMALSMLPMLMFIGNLQYVFIAAIGGILAITGRIPVTVGTIASFLQLSKTLSGPMMQTAQQINQVVLALAGASRIFSFLDTPIDRDDAVVELINAEIGSDGEIQKSDTPTGKWAWYDPENADKPYTLLEGDIRFFDVDFSYDGKTKVLENISLFAKPGQKLAFVGPTGAGKTTITNMINRFYDITSGKITYDGIDINRIKKKHLRKSLGMVLQDTHLFTGTVKENLKFGADDATHEQVIQGAKRAKAHDFIVKLKDGYDTVISGTESDLSAGQAQLLSIARAEISNPPVMILDEATSSIDSRTEKIVQEGMDEIMKGRTTFVIAHRLSTIVNADAIIVLKDGKIVERGDHDDLLGQKGIYYNLYMSGFEEND